MFDMQVLFLKDVTISGAQREAHKQTQTRTHMTKNEKFLSPFAPQLDSIKENNLLSQPQ